MVDELNFLLMRSFLVGILIIEYREIQHYKSVNFMDKRITISGVNRGEQRRIYDLRKEKWAEDNKVLLIIAYADLAHKNNGKLIRNEDLDRAVLKTLI